MMILLIIVLSIIVYAFIGGVYYEFFPTKLYGQRLDISSDGKVLWSVLWIIWWIAIIIIGVFVIPRRFGRWLIKKLDERFDIRK